MYIGKYIPATLECVWGLFAMKFQPAEIAKDDVKIPLEVTILDDDIHPCWKNSASETNYYKKWWKWKFTGNLWKICWWKARFISPKDILPFVFPEKKKFYQQIYAISAYRV